MELSNATKWSELGHIPEDWDILPIEDVAQIKNGLTYSPSNVSKNGTLVLRSSNIQDDRLSFINNVFVDCSVPEKKRVEKGDILICVRNGSRNLIGKCALINEKADGEAFGAFMAVLSSDISDYLIWQFRSSIMQKQIQEHLGATINQITNSSLKAFKVILPTSTRERQAITKVLSDVDAFIASLEKLIEKQQRLYKATMSKLFTSGAKINSPKNKWSLKTVEHFGIVITGGTPPTSDRSNWGGHYPWITPSDISENTHILSGERSITEKGLNLVRSVPANSLLVTCIASIGKNTITKSFGSCNQQINAIIPNDNFDVNFLYFLFEYHKESFLRSAGITATPMISKKQFLRTEFLVPNLLIQKQIAEILMTSQQNLLELKHKLLKAKKVKIGMMQELLTGRMRLI